MSQNSYILNPWILSLTTILFVGAAYSVQFFQWNSLNHYQSQTHRTTQVLGTYQDHDPEIDISRPAYFSSFERDTNSDEGDLALNNYPPKAPSLDENSESSKQTPVISKVETPVFLQPKKTDKNLVIQDKQAIHLSSEETLELKHSDFENSANKVPPEVESIESKVVYFQPSIDELLQSLVVVEYPDEIVLEFEKSVFSEKLMQQLLVRFILSSNPMDNYQLLQATLNKSSFQLREQPHYFQRILNDSKQPIRYPAQAYSYAEELLKTKRDDVIDQDKTYVQVSIPLHSLVDLTGFHYSQAKSSPAVKKLPFANYVEQFSQQFAVPKSLIYAIMETESAFNPSAVSKSNALGLMQIKANAAGKDVYRYVYGKSEAPSEQVLFNPKENIRIGAAYLALLDGTYFAEVEDAEKRQLLVIAAYNGGLKKVFELFGKTEKQAIERINSLSIQSVYQALTLRHPSIETKNYVVKVKRTQQIYKEKLG